ncbi:hypothetical protein UQ28_20160 [Escherichia coli]|nr:hypothetical protein UQ28_20160 [Escherichia coli]
MLFFFFFSMCRRQPRPTPKPSSAAAGGYKDQGLKIVRQSLPYGTASGTHGLYFCAYCARLHNIEQQLLSMFGDTDGKRDAMLRFTKPVTGGYYFAPSLDKLMAL